MIKRHTTRAAAVRLHKAKAAAIALAILVANTAQSASAAANTLSELWRSLSTCIQMPNESVGSELTIVFALKRDGSLLGRPRITYSHLVGDADPQKAFVADAI